MTSTKPRQFYLKVTLLQTSDIQVYTIYASVYHDLAICHLLQTHSWNLYVCLGDIYAVMIILYKPVECEAVAVKRYEFPFLDQEQASIYQPTPEDLTDFYNKQNRSSQYITRETWRPAAWTCPPHWVAGSPAEPSAQTRQEGLSAAPSPAPASCRSWSDKCELRSGSVNKLLTWVYW